MNLPEHDFFFYIPWDLKEIKAQTEAVVWMYENTKGLHQFTHVKVFILVKHVKSTLSADP